MEPKDMQAKIQDINKALNDAVLAINNAKTMIKDLENQNGLSPKLIPGTFGKFIGDAMLTDDNLKIEVPSNYASKSVLVYGDRMKMFEENGEKKFKQIERVKRLRVEGVLAKKEGKWHVVTSDGSYRVLDAAVEHFGAAEGNMLVVLLPLDDKYVPYAAIESVVGKPKAAVAVVSEPITKPVDQSAMEAPNPVSVSIPIKPIAQVNSITGPVSFSNVAPVSDAAKKKRKRKKKSSAINSGTTAQTFSASSSVAAQTMQQPLIKPAVIVEPVKQEVSRILTDEDLR